MVEIVSSVKYGAGSNETREEIEYSGRNGISVAEGASRKRKGRT